VPGCGADGLTTCGAAGVTEPDCGAGAAGAGAVETGAAGPAGRDAGTATTGATGATGGLTAAAGGAAATGAAGTGLERAARAAASFAWASAFAADCVPGSSSDSPLIFARTFTATSSGIELE
jgi:hypothetical protein